jgi:hypothetical protein
VRGSAARGIGGNNGKQQAKLAFAQCMQTHGVPNFPEPDPNGAIVALSGVDLNSPRVPEAVKRMQVEAAR